MDILLDFLPMRNEGVRPYFSAQPNWMMPMAYEIIVPKVLKFFSAILIGKPSKTPNFQVVFCFFVFPIEIRRGKLYNLIGNIIVDTAG